MTGASPRMITPPQSPGKRLPGSLLLVKTMGWVWGPLYGAMLVRFLSWEWQFWLNVPLAIAGVAAAWVVLSPTRRAAPVDAARGVFRMSHVRAGIAELGPSDHRAPEKVIVPGAQKGIARPRLDLDAVLGDGGDLRRGDDARVDAGLHSVEHVTSGEVDGGGGLGRGLA